MNKLLKKYLTLFVGKRLNLLYKYNPEKAAKKSFKLFMTPRKGGVRPDQKAFLDEAKAEEIEVDGLKIQSYFWPGGKKKVLLMHGWESNAARWRQLIAQLQTEHYTIISLDAPAHGNSEGKRSDVPLYGKAIEKLADEHKFQFAIGHSLGGLTLLYQLYKKPINSLEKIILLAPAVEMINLIYGFKNKLKLKPGLIEVMEELFEKEYGFNFSEFSMLKLMEDFSIPALFIHDKEDKIVRYKESVSLVEQWSNAELLLTKGLNHSLRGEKVNTMILNFLKEAEQL